MVFELAEKDFMNLMENPRFSLPRRWDGKDFESTLASLFETYNKAISHFEKPFNWSNSSITVDTDSIRYICNELIACVHEYHSGFPSRAFSKIENVMGVLIEKPLRIYQKSGDLEPLENDKLYLYRVRKVDSGAAYSRESLFHVPTSARNKISTCRYSIAGYPSLYLSTSIELALAELNSDSRQAIVSRFKLNRSQPRINIQVLELGIKPQDYYTFYNDDENRANIDLYNNYPENSNTKSPDDLLKQWDEIQSRNDRIKHLLKEEGFSLRSTEVREAYLLWFPIIAACSFVRADRNAPFASEYIVPQLLMQWIRTESKPRDLLGLRYFSCASMRASEMGFDYIFPVSDSKCKGGFCSVLRDAFSLTEPVYIRDYEGILQCEKALKADLSLARIRK